MIKALVFDFGDVFINLDKTATFKALQALEKVELTFEMLDKNLDYEQGLISTDEFIHFYQQQFPSASKSELINAWNSILLDFPLERLQFLQALKKSKHYQLILLSNTNELHIDWVAKHLDFYPEFKACFDQFYLSHEIHLRKPNREIFDFVLAKNNLLAKDCFFIDDTAENTEMAKQLGFSTWNINPQTDSITDLFLKFPHLQKD